MPMQRWMSFNTPAGPFRISNLLVCIMSCVLLMTCPHALAQPGSEEPFRDYEENGFLRNHKKLNPDLSTNTDKVTNTCKSLKLRPIIILRGITPPSHLNRRGVVPFSFVVDSTIRQLVIHINGPERLPVYIVDPTGYRRELTVRSIHEPLPDKAKISKRSLHPTEMTSSSNFTFVTLLTRRNTSVFNTEHNQRFPELAKFANRPLSTAHIKNSSQRKRKRYFRKTSGSWVRENVKGRRKSPQKLRERNKRAQFGQKIYHTKHQNAKRNLQKTNIMKDVDNNNIMIKNKDRKKLKRNRYRRHPLQQPLHLQWKQQQEAKKIYPSIPHNPSPLTSREKYQSGQIFYRNGNKIYWNPVSPQPGFWRINVGHFRGPTTVMVNAVGAINFRFQFLDLDTKEPTTHYVPIAGEASAARVDIEDMDCISHLDMRIKLYTEKYGNVFSYDFNVDVGLRDRYTIPIYFQMPPEPFYPVFMGRDFNGVPFQRWHPDIIVPRLFLVTMATRRTEHLYPGGPYVFGVNIENKACRSGLFAISAVLDHAVVNHIVIDRPTNVVEIKAHRWGQGHVQVSVYPSISVIERRNLTITVSCSDRPGQAQPTEISLTACPASYQTDYEAPTSSIVKRCGICVPSLPCYTQTWGVLISVEDKLTGVQSVTFDMSDDSLHYASDSAIDVTRNINESTMDYNVNTKCNDVMTENGVDKAIHYAGSYSHRAAEVDYRSNCCHRKFRLAVTDYADNKASYLIEAPTQMITVIHPLKGSESTEAPPIHVKHSHTTRAATSTASPSTPSSPSTTTTTTTTTIQETTYVQPTDNHGVKHMQSTWLDNKFSVLRIVAVVLGGIGVISGIAMCVICLMYKYRYRLMRRIRKRAINKQKNRERTGSDITMGSSLESRSFNGSFGENSVFGGSVRSDFSGISQETTRELTHFGQDNRENVRFLFNANNDTNRLESAGTVAGTCETCLSGGSIICGHKCDCSDSGSHNSSLSVNARLRSGGNTYVSMMDAQRRMEDIESLQQKIRARAAAVKRGETETFNQQTRGNQRHYGNASSENSQVNLKLNRYGDGSVRYASASQRRQESSSDDDADEYQRYTNGTGQMYPRRIRPHSGDSGYITTNGDHNSAGDVSSLGESPSYSGLRSSANGGPPHEIEADFHHNQIAGDYDYSMIRSLRDADYAHYATPCGNVRYTTEQHIRQPEVLDTHEDDQYSPRRRRHSYGVICVKQNTEDHARRADDDISVNYLLFHRATLMQESSTGEVRRVPVLVRSLPKRLRPYQQNSEEITLISNMFVSGSDTDLFTSSSCPEY